MNMKNNNHPKLAILFVLLLVTIGCREKTEQKQELLRPVRYMLAEIGYGQKVRTFSGFAKVGSDITLSFRTAGIIVENNVSKGQRVTKGQLLGRLDNIEAQLANEKAISEVNRAESEMNTAKTNFDRIKLLYEKGAKPLNEYESAQNNFKSATSQYEMALRNKEIQQTQIEYGYVYAPKNGVILETDGEVNEGVTAGHKFVVLSVSEGRMKVTVNLPESVINQIKLNVKVQITFSAIPGKEFTGEVTEISPSVSEQSATYPVEIEIIDPTTDIKQGMAANVTFNFENERTSQDNVIIVPVKVVGEDEKGNFVFVLNTDDNKVGHVVKQHVELGQLTAEGFEILKGLTAGQKIVTAGLQTLLDGQKVKLQ